ncbi:M20 family metallopeptidase [Amphibacillus indicireducens]|uniref:Peptidase M20 domain-containing protein 2 n=1 Tax=Amphibacillus indicireducens TaxID=1076330 RepID=A0ABP7W3K3_9BACI
MTVVNGVKERLFQSIDEGKALYVETSHKIHDNPEIGNEEYFACDLHSENLVNAGFEVEKGVAGHETAFYAVRESGKPGPTIAYLAEYDALPGLGHACGHNIIGTLSVAAAIALGELIDDTGGRVVVLGTPAEEGGPNGSAKGSFADQGFLKDVDVALMLHPGGKTGLTPESLAVDPLDFKFYGKPAHASGAPHLGVNALDAVIQLFNGISALRQQLPDDVRIHGIITHGGDAPNIIPEFASARFYIRAESWKKTEETAERVRAIAKGAALATGARVVIERFQNVVKDLVPTPVLDQVLAEELTAVGENVIVEKRKGKGSTDAGNISYEVPTAHGGIKIGPDDLAGHTVEFREAAKSEQGDQAIITGAKALALTGYRLLTDQKLLEKVKQDHQQALKQKRSLS